MIELSMIMGGPQKQPPFIGPSVGNSWLIYKQRVPKM
jgi:hypothetical protein